ncbi:hypothetical protein HF313_16330 [Massilia atriviolacea]|uniref:hypothetical protein n=1 Tax=Massilia atriviolacea TaxID=2495579 RepID=UPI0013DF73B6|nr:hypothetical protein [Massilia atriviolacea]
MTDIGVVRPNAHGQAMMSTASPSTKPNTQAGSGPNMSDMATATDRGKVHQNLRLTSASSGFSSPSSEGNAGSSASCIAGNCPAWHAEFPDAPDHCDPDGNFIGMGLPEHDRAAARPQRESWTFLTAGFFARNNACDAMRCDASAIAPARGVNAHCLGDH